MNLSLSDAGKKTLLAIARETLEAKLENRTPRHDDPTPEIEASCGVFVTLRSASGDLRGCIGNLTGRGKPLHELVAEMALASAFEDPRFPPVGKGEIKTLSLEISILSAFQDAAAEDVIPGMHGIFIRKGYNSGLLLPQVATEQGWDRVRFLSHGCLKAGIPPESWRQKDTAISIFTALVFHE
ncbi:MAG: AmmeMemoRadiSam system protein A [Spirochaetales bacterium]|jgi:AmmeMemoRadiSam system protein A|nr:AmmeMemoRadiSam system protein A [Spirochaetales bacterium]